MGNTNQSVSSNMSYGDRARQRRPSNAEALGPLEVPIGSKKYQDPSTTPPNSQAKFGKSLLDQTGDSVFEQDFVKKNLQTDVSSPQQLSAVEQQPYTRRYRAGSISISMQMPSPTPAPPPQLKKDKIPAVIKWDKGGKEIFVSGSFNNWETKIPLVKSESNFYTIIDLPEGEHHYKFLVDGQWKHNPDEPAMKSSKGSLHNTMKVAKEDFEILEALKTDKDATNAVKKMESTTGRQYNDDDAPEQETYGREIPTRKPTDRHTGPPILPPHLLQVILNKDVSDHLEPGMLPEPNHVMLNHLYALSIKDGVMVLSDTSRYKKKYVTTLLYKPIDS